MPQPIHHTDLDDSDALRWHLIIEHDLAADDVPRTRDALDGVHDRIHEGVPVPGATVTHRSDRPNTDIPAETVGAANTRVRRCTAGVRALTRQDPQLAGAMVARHCRDLRAILTAATHADHARDQEHAERPVMTGERLRDLLVSLVPTDDTHKLSAHPVGLLLSRGRHALDITDHDGRIWRVDVHDHPRTVDGSPRKSRPV